MSYTEIILVTADSAYAGDLINIYVFIKNLMVPEGTLNGEPVVDVDGVLSRVEGEYRGIYPWVAFNIWGKWEMTEYGLMYAPNWKFTFTMPNKPVTVSVESWIEQEPLGIPWHKDATASKSISLKERAPEFQAFAISDYSKV